jgi:AcrR family transcriptional regulator
MARTAPQRLTRVQSRARTRARLLEAAEALFIAKGFNGTSVEEIAEHAGFTRGAFYSNFEDKDDIFVAILDKKLKDRIEEIAAIMRKSSSLEDAFRVIRRGNETRDVKPWSILHAEFWLYAARNPRARRKLAELQRTERRAYARAIDAQFRSLGLEPPRLDDASVVMQVLDEGVFRQRLIDPDEVRETFFFDAVLQLFEGAVALARERKRSKK